MNPAVLLDCPLALIVGFFAGMLFNHVYSRKDK